MGPRLPLAPPSEIVNLARQVMGAIDLDAYGHPDLSPMIGAKEFHDRDAGVQGIYPGGKNRVLMAVTGTCTGHCRQLLHRLRESWVKGHTEEAIFWTPIHDTLRQCPWVFDQPLMVCFPFRRLAARWLDDEWDRLRKVSSASWSFIVYFPQKDDLPASRARFFGAAGKLGRIVEAGASPVDWRAGYEALMLRPFPYDTGDAKD